MVALGDAHDGGAEEQEQRGDEQRGAPPQPVEQVAGDEQRAEAGDEVEARGRRLLLERAEVQRARDVGEAAGDDADVVAEGEVVDRRERGRQDDAVAHRRRAICGRLHLHAVHTGTATSRIGERRVGAWAQLGLTLDDDQTDRPSQRRRLGLSEILSLAPSNRSLHTTDQPRATAPRATTSSVPSPLSL
eukprot:scaffold69556_cov63-Phaeocystis_antarctica.AAC.1